MNTQEKLLDLISRYSVAVYRGKFILAKELEQLIEETVPIYNKEVEEEKAKK